MQQHQFEPPEVSSSALRRAAEIFTLQLQQSPRKNPKGRYVKPKTAITDPFKFDAARGALTDVRARGRIPGPVGSGTGKPFLQDVKQTFCMHTGATSADAV
ncbi:hypothetical protein [Roseovarius spongiae]|uniref:hypothetical protein n=1 Tax=Roseovarius spongiae TaxID=2320272 RepID=UPI0011C4A1A9|nr:hypothetical protein [Roseovarius spongiae]